MKRFLLALLCLCPSVFAEDIIITTNGDVTAGLSRDHTRAMGFPNSPGYEGSIVVLVGEDSTSSTAHKLFVWYSEDDGNNWDQRGGRPFTTPSGWASSAVDPIMSYYKATTNENDTLWMLPPSTYSGSNMQAVRLVGTNINGTDTINPGKSTMLTGLMRWKNGGDTLIYAYYDGIGGYVIVVRSDGAWSQAVTWTPIDTLVADFSDIDQDYCGSGVAIWERYGRDMYWIDGTVNDAIYTLGTDKIPALLSTTAKNATTMAVYRDSMIVVIGYLARDTCLWEYRWWATGGTRKTGMTLIDSTKLLPKNYFTGTAVDSASPMPCLSGTVDGDTAVLQVRYWRNPSNTDSIVIGRSLAGGSCCVAAFDSVNLIRNSTSYGEGKRYRNLCAPRYITGNAVVFWQKGISTPDTIYASIDDKMTWVVETLSQNKAALGGRWLYFGGANNNTVSVDSGIIEDTYMSAADASTNYSTADSIGVTLSGTASTTRAALWRPILKGRVPMPARPVWAEWEGKYNINRDSSTGSTNNVRFFPCWRPARVGEITNTNYRTTPSTTAWTSSQARSLSGTAIFSTTTSNPDYSTAYLSTAPFVQDGVTKNNNTAGYNSGSTLVQPLTLNMSFWSRVLSSELADSIGWVKMGKAASGVSGVTSFWSVNHSTTTNRPVFRILVVHAEHKWRYSAWIKPNALIRYRSKATLYTPL